MAGLRECMLSLSSVLLRYSRNQSEEYAKNIRKKATPDTALASEVLLMIECEIWR